MTKATAQMSVSLDGHYAGPRHDGDGNWMDSAEAAGFFRITRWVIDAMSWRERLGFASGEHDTNSEIVAETFEAAGAYVMGRRMADCGEAPWGGKPRSTRRSTSSRTVPAKLWCARADELH